MGVAASMVGALAHLPTVFAAHTTVLVDREATTIGGSQADFGVVSRNSIGSMNKDSL